MTGHAGRKTIVRVNGTTIPGAREKSLAFNAEAIDLTDDDSAGKRELAAESATDSCDIEISGVTKDATLRKLWNDGKVTPELRMVTLEVVFPQGDIISGTFRLGNYSQSEPFADASTFQSSFQSSGDWTYTAAP